MKSTLTDHSPKMKCKNLVIFMSHLQNNLHIFLCLTLSPSVLTFTGSAPYVFIQAYRRAATHSLCRQDITFTRHDFYEANFMSFSVRLGNRGFQDQEGFHSLQHLPNIWLPPTQDRNFAIAPESGLDCWPGQSAPTSTPSQQTEFYKEKKKK